MLCSANAVSGLETGVSALHFTIHSIEYNLDFYLKHSATLQVLREGCAHT